jgi:CheY-like chemotaxis protein
VDDDPDLPLEMIGDMTRVKQIAVNLLTNAVKFTKQGHIIFKVGAEPVDSEEASGKYRLKMSVTDTGIGIRKEEIPLLFASFSQLDTRKNRGIEGTGLGLAISRQLVELMDGGISVESVYGEGSCFSFDIIQQVEHSEPALKRLDASCHAAVWFANAEKARVVAGKITRLGARCTRLDGPESGYTHVFFDVDKYERVRSAISQDARLIAVSSWVMDNPKLPAHVKLVSAPITSLSLARLLDGGTTDPAGTDALKPPDISLRLRNTRLLVVDDIEINLFVAEQMLLLYGGEVSVANSGPRAVELVQQNDYDIVFMDHMMPEVDGVDATKLIRALPGKKYQKLPIVALTANVVGDVRDMLVECGMNDFLSKPLEVDEIERVLREWLPPDKWSLEGAIKGPD